jgi:hypothetical protein
VPHPEREAVRIDLAGAAQWLLIQTLPRGSGLEVTGSSRGLGTHRLPLRGAWNLGATRPTGLAYAPERGLLAVANRSGGVHLLALSLSRRFTTKTQPIADLFALRVQVEYAGSQELHGMAKVDVEGEYGATAWVSGDGSGAGPGFRTAILSAVRVDRTGR